MLKRRSDTDFKNKQWKTICSGGRGFLDQVSVEDKTWKVAEEVPVFPLEQCCPCTLEHGWIPSNSQMPCDELATNPDVYAASDHLKLR